MKTVVILVLLVVVLVLVILRQPSDYTSKTIPKTIWTYWDDENIPPFIQKCLNNWKRFNPDYNIQILKKNSIPKELHGLSAQRQSDWIRLHQLRNFGGIWMDASVITTESLDWVRKQVYSQNAEGFMYYSTRHTVDENFPVIESWFIAAVPGSETISKWFDEFNFACREFGNDGDAYLRHLEEKYGSEMKKKIVANIDWPSYLTVYVCHQKVLHIDNVSPKRFLWADDASGPYIYHYNTLFLGHKTISALSEKPAEFTPKMVKLYGEDRRHIKDDAKLHPDSFFAKYLGA
jgi:hypothetical protein